ncbi:MAG: tRNA (N6-isopentenyl adenosine(37)-C2)-methylthiotransferase MiaB [Proteobacteria bacterium]|nr:tRNA (N6-isopentenyl adenosine(37)-C2)-methylthiotransferase MiaB [Pseudomonadota bacterium]MBU1584016.1 tRNA (N6-isopentenyl adenosine(37)-C2)-methylthiotransferase MiaB [Pseudomonadota bacterium]MBU2630900.1 tRNA (N6-isopentenyl adenosine(37)-C2)-methylthiotransferase MiaB [Pseudomonadota bacterium]
MKYKGYAYIYTIGCQMNVYDSEKLGAILKSYGFEKTEDMDIADIIVCNTCSIRHKAEEKAFSFLGRFARIKKKKPHLITVMAGCVAQQEGEKAFERVPHLDMVLGTQAFSRFGQHIDALKSGGQKIVDTNDAPMIYEALPDTTCFNENKISKFVTIMQGCDNFCTYCVVPYVRGRERSRRPENIVEEITLLARSGVREVTLLGQNVNSYGLKEGMIPFPQLLAKINDIKGIQRIRFATSHPKDLSEDLMHAIRDLDKVCNHLHLPVQSGANTILKKMNRGYTRETYIHKISELKKLCPQIALSTDIIVGFPSESRTDFYDTMNLLREIEFDSIFAFAYSDRSSAPAAKFSNQIDEKEKLDRLNQLLELQETYTIKKNTALVGTILDILVEGESTKKRDGFEPGFKKQMKGRSQSNKIVHFPSGHVNIGDMIKIRIENAYPHSLWGHPLGV